MKKINHFILAFLILCVGFTNIEAKPKPGKKTKNYPETFTISKLDFEKLMGEKLNTTLKFTNNVYINNAVLQMNTKNGDMHFVKLKLSYFPKSYLMIQENGIYSTVIFIMSDDKSVFYKGKLNPDSVIMKKCSEDDIVSE